VYIPNTNFVNYITLVDQTLPGSIWSTPKPDYNVLEFLASKLIKQD